MQFPGVNDEQKKWVYTVPVFSRITDRVIGSRKLIDSKWSSSVVIDTDGFESFSSLSNSRRTVV